MRAFMTVRPIRNSVAPRWLEGALFAIVVMLAMRASAQAPSEAQAEPTVEPDSASEALPEQSQPSASPQIAPPIWQSGGSGEASEIPPEPGGRRRSRPSPRVGAPVLTIGVGLGFGFLMNSSDQTQYIKDWQDSQGDIVLQVSGVADIILYFLPRLSLSYSPFRYGRMQAIFEYGWAPKIVEVQGGSSRFFSYSRVSAGLLASLELPISRNRLKAFDLGAGPVFHYAKFEEHAGMALGAKAQTSLFVRVGQANQMEVYVAYDYAPGRSSTNSAFALDYSSITFGFVFHVSLIGRE